MRKTFAFILMITALLTSSPSPGQTQKVRPLDMSSTFVSASPNPANHGETVTITAGVYPSYCYGVITFTDYGNWLGQANLSSGVASMQTSSLSIGGHSLQASYDGEDQCDPSTSSTYTLNINAYSTTTTLSSGTNPSTYSQSVTYTASVSPSAATGTVTFKDGSSTIGTGTLSGGAAHYTLSTLTAGSHSITAVYGGDSNYIGSTSSAVNQTVYKASPTITWSNPAAINYGTALSGTQLNASVSGVAGTFAYIPASGTVLSAGSNQTLSTTFTPTDSTDYNTATKNVLITVNKANSSVGVASNFNPSTYGNLVTLTATITATPSTETGTVSFYDNGMLLPNGTATVSSGGAVYSTSNLSAATHPITVTYSGDANFNGSSSNPPPLSQVVNAATGSITLTSSPNPSFYGGTVTFTATVNGVSPTGTVTFYDFSSNVTLGSGALDGNGHATLSVNTLSPLAHAITAHYNGDQNNNPSTSGVMQQTVNRRSTPAPPSYCVY